MVLTRDELLARVSDRIGDDTSDEAIRLLEDVADTYDEVSARAADQTDWEQRYNELDQSWRQRYIDRFNGKVESDSDFVEEPKDADETVLEYETPKTYEELFQPKED